MCVILSIIKIKEDDEKLNNSITNTIELLKESNGDGVGVIALENKKKWFYQRGLEIKKQKIQEIINNFKIINIHLRFSTSGLIADKNVHFWQIGEWFFAHNGTISGKEYNSNKKCDSFNLFKKLIRMNCFGKNGTIKTKKINDIVSDSSFWGRFIIANPKRNKIYYFGDFHLYVLDRKMMIIASKEINFKKNTLNFLGIEFDNKQQIDILEKKIDGIFSFDLRNNKMKTIAEEFNKYTISSKWKDDYYCYYDDDEKLSKKEKKKKKKEERALDIHNKKILGY